jgi:hypothetical protein
MAVSRDDAINGDLSSGPLSPTALGAVDFDDTTIAAWRTEPDIVDVSSFVVGDGMVLEYIVATALDTAGLRTGSTCSCPSPAVPWWGR